MGEFSASVNSDGDENVIKRRFAPIRARLKKSNFFQLHAGRVQGMRL